MKSMFFRLAVVVAVALPASAFAQAKFVGEGKCKSCHGAVVTQLKSGPHAKAFETLGTPEAKKVGAKAGVTDPQADAKCLKCHVTASGAEGLPATMKKESGVQCESCHGAGGNHVKARMAAEENSKPAPGEIDVKPAEKVCTTCHNKESPTFKGFKYADAVAKIKHTNKK